MDNQPIGKETNKFSEELLEALLQEEPIYPWNLAEPEVEEYFAETEDNFSLLECLDSEEIANRAENLFTHLHQCWESTDTVKIKKSLFVRFGNLIPESWLETIVQRSVKILAANLSPIRQLVECVKPLLSNWTEEDLNAFARFSLDCQESKTDTSIESDRNWGKQAKWNELSQAEQALLSLTIARYTLMQLQAETPQ